MDALYEVVLLPRAEGVADDGHLAMRSELYGARHAASANSAITGPFQDQRPTALEVLVSRNQQNRLTHIWGRSNRWDCTRSGRLSD